MQSSITILNAYALRTTIQGVKAVRHETHTQLKREEIFEAAKRYFGQEEGGLGMKVSAHQGNQIAFFGDGLVWVTVWPARQGNKETRVDLDVSNRDADARAFIEKVLKAPHAAAGR